MSWRIGIFAVLGAALCALACDDRAPKTRAVIEDFAVVPGTPQVEAGTPKVQIDPARNTGNFKINVPHQCDLFQQLTTRKVDILWMVDSSGSMAPKQARLAANFNGFMSQLVAARPPIDFHIAVATTDTDDIATAGVLRTWMVNNKTSNFIACTPAADGGSDCSTAPAGGGTAGALTAFQQMATVGISGSAQERGLLNAYLVLTNSGNQSNAQHPDRFVRPDADLYVVLVSDEDDSSCYPLVSQPICTTDPGCRCAPDSLLAGVGSFGSTGYFTRFFETYKGFANQNKVTVAAIVALDGSPDAGVPSQFGDLSQHVGCCRSVSGDVCPKGGVNDGGFEVAYFGGRYVKVASDTGGVAVNICDTDFSGALASLGYAASGLRKEFRLTRGPDLRAQGAVAQGVALWVSAPNAANCQVDGNCPGGESCRSNRCARRVDVKVGAAPDAGAEYVKCDGSLFRNVVRFSGSAVPESLSAIEICYDVQADFQNSCP